MGDLPVELHHHPEARVVRYALHARPGAVGARLQLHANLGGQLEPLLFNLVTYAVRVADLLERPAHGGLDAQLSSIVAQRSDTELNELVQLRRVPVVHTSTHLLAQLAVTNEPVELLGRLCHPTGENILEVYVLGDAVPRAVVEVADLFLVFHCTRSRVAFLHVALRDVILDRLEILAVLEEALEEGVLILGTPQLPLPPRLLLRCIWPLCGPAATPTIHRQRPRACLGPRTLDGAYAVAHRGAPLATFDLGPMLLRFFSSSLDRRAGSATKPRAASSGVGSSKVCMLLLPEKG